MEYINSLKYSLHVIFRPFDGFWDLKREHKGSVKSALTLVALTILTYIISRQYTAFLFNYYNVKYLNIFIDVITVTLLYILWCVSNWCLTSLMDGEGSFKDIAISTAYALTPIILINLPLVPVSHLITVEEGALYYLLTNISYIWSAGLLLLGTMVTHQYSMTKTFFTVIFILLGMAIMMFIGLLFFNVIQQIVSFAVILYREIVFRL